jgi:putative ABC transport system ATP-binding protein
MSEPVMIKVQGLTKTYQVGDVAVHALRGVDLEIQRGEFVAIIGASGSGKSTLFHILGGLTPMSSGSVRIDGHDLAGLTNAERTELRKKTVGFVFQKYNLLPTLSAEDNIRIVQYIADRETAFDPAFQEVLKLLGIADRLKHKPRALSGGQQQRVAIVRSLMMHPSIMLFDEPTSALDPELTGEVLKVIRELAIRGRTSVIVTHELAFAREVASKVVFMDQGLVAEEGPPEHVLANPKTERALAFIRRSM